MINPLKEEIKTINERYERLKESHSVLQKYVKDRENKTNNIK